MGKKITCYTCNEKADHAAYDRGDRTKKVRPKCTQCCKDKSIIVGGLNMLKPSVLTPLFDLPKAPTPKGPYDLD